MGPLFEFEARKYVTNCHTAGQTIVVVSKLVRRTSHPAKNDQDPAFGDRARPVNYFPH
jgi:hypothetical protein